jgi:hypothetical protein
MINNFQQTRYIASLHPNYCTDAIYRVSTSQLLYRRDISRLYVLTRYIASLRPNDISRLNSPLLISLNSVAVLAVVFRVLQQIRLSRD